MIGAILLWTGGLCFVFFILSTLEGIISHKKVLTYPIEHARIKKEKKMGVEWWRIFKHLKLKKEINEYRQNEAMIQALKDRLDEYSENVRGDTHDSE